MSSFLEPIGRIEAIMQNILGGKNELPDDTISSTERIFLSILKDEEYTEEPQTSTEEILLAIKTGGTYTKPAQSRIEEILLCKLNGKEFTGTVYSRMEYLLALWTTDDWSKLFEFPFTIEAGEPVEMSVIGG